MCHSPVSDKETTFVITSTTAIIFKGPVKSKDIEVFKVRHDKLSFGSPFIRLPTVFMELT